MFLQPEQAEHFKLHHRIEHCNAPKNSIIQGWADKSAQVSNGWYYSHEAKCQHSLHSGDCLHLYFSRYCDVSSIYEEYRMEQAKRNAIAELCRADCSPADIAKVLKYPRTTVYDVCK